MAAYVAPSLWQGEPCTHHHWSSHWERQCVGLSGGIPTTACSLRGNTDTQAAQVVVPSPASCVQSCSSVQITRLCVSPNISRGCCVLPQDLGQDIHHNRSTRDGFHSRLHFGSSITGVGRSHLVGTPTCGGLTFSDAQNLPLGSRSVDPSFNSSWVSRLSLTVRVACSTPVLNHTQRSCVANILIRWSARYYNQDLFSRASALEQRSI
jgi:hypothetical protein